MVTLCEQKIGGLAFQPLIDYLISRTKRKITEKINSRAPMSIVPVLVLSLKQQLWTSGAAAMMKMTEGLLVLH